MSATLIDHPLRSRTRLPCEPLRYRATITIDFEAGDDVQAQEQRAAIETAFSAIQPAHKDTRLEFRRRRLRARPRPGAPGLIIAAYADD